MSRLEKTEHKKSKKRKWRFVSKVLFILFMSFNLTICIYIINTNAKKMLGEEVYNIEEVKNDVGVFINEKFTYIDTKVKVILSQFNK